MYMAILPISIGNSRKMPYCYADIYESNTSHGVTSQYIFIHQQYEAQSSTINQTTFKQP